MNVKLTLRMEEEIIEKAKKWAKTRHVSLSHAVAVFFAQIAEEKGASPLDSWTRKLTGIASDERKPPADKTIRQEYLNYLETKHK